MLGKDLVSEPQIQNEKGTKRQRETRKKTKHNTTEQQTTQTKNKTTTNYKPIKESPNIIKPRKDLHGKQYRERLKNRRLQQTKFKPYN